MPCVGNIVFKVFLLMRNTALMDVSHGHTCIHVPMHGIYIVNDGAGDTSSLEDSSLLASLISIVSCKT